MISDDERREVAARLRELPSDVYAARKEWEEGGLFIDASLSDEADYSQIHNTVFGCFPAEHMHPVDYEELHERLADLIDLPTCHDVADFDRESFKCSRCGFRVLSIDGTPDAAKLVGTNGGVVDFGFCPNCGAEVIEEGYCDAQEL